MAFTSSYPIRFSHCDPAGIVYFPNFFDMINAAIEDWFDQALDTPLRTLHMERRVGFPVVNTQCEFLHPCQFGDRLDLALSVAHLGHSSLTLAVSGRVCGEEKLRATHTMSMISLDSYQAITIPDELRAKIEPHVTGAASA